MPLSRLAGISLIAVGVAPGVFADALQPPPCDGSILSRWSSQGGYQRGAVFGQTRGSWLQALTGIDATPDKVFIFDGRESRVHILDASLRPVHQFGRRGGGPGEFSVPMRPEIDIKKDFTANYVTADDSLVYVYDGRSIQTFNHDGDYVDRVATVRQGMTPLSLRMLKVTEEGLLYTYDSLDLAGNAGRRLQTWRVTSNNAALIDSFRMRPPPTAGARFSVFSRDPRPIWAAHGHCLYLADGESHQVIRTNLARGTSDTVRLPAHSVPPDNYDARQHKRLAESMGTEVVPRPRDAPLWTWAALIVDPDGHVWVRPWTSSGRPEGAVFRIDPEGRVHRERLSAFPVAFGPPGVYYARAFDEETDEVLVVRYERRSR